MTVFEGVPTQDCEGSINPEDFTAGRAGARARGATTIVSAFVSLLLFRVRSRASFELVLIALRHQVIVCEGNTLVGFDTFSADRLL